MQILQPSFIENWVFYFKFFAVNPKTVMKVFEEKWFFISEKFPVVSFIVLEIVIVDIYLFTKEALS